MDFKDEKKSFNVHSRLPNPDKPRAADDIQVSHVREDWVMDYELQKDLQAVTLDGSRDLFKIIQNSPISDIRYPPRDPLECEDTVIKDLSAKALGENLHTESNDQGLSSAMSSLTEVLAQCSLLTKSNQVEIETSDDLMDRFASFVKQRIEDALDPLRAPVAFVFQRRWEVERKRRHDFLALEEKKLVLRRKKIQLKRRHGGRVRRSTRRASSNSARSSRRSSSDEVKALSTHN